MNKDIVSFKRKSGVKMKDINLVDVDLKRDIQEISNYIQSYVDTTYLSQIRSQIKNHKRQCAEIPFPEVQLLNAMVPFVEENTRDRFLNIINMITYSKMIESMLPHYGIENFFGRTANTKKGPNDYIHQAVVALVLYRVIVWSEEPGIIV